MTKLVHSSVTRCGVDLKSTGNKETERSEFEQHFDEKQQGAIADEEVGSERVFLLFIRERHSTFLC